MNPGRLREAITVEKPELSSDPNRSPTRSESWTKAFDAKAKVKLDNQRSDVIGGKENPRQRATFIVHNRDGYNPDRRIIWNGDTYRIEASRPKDNMRRYLEVSAIYTGD